MASLASLDHLANGQANPVDVAETADGADPAEPAAKGM